MGRKTNSADSRLAPALWERLLISPIQLLTDLLVSCIRSGRPVSDPNTVRIGKSPNLFRPHEIDEIHLELSKLNRGVYLAGKSGSGKTSLILLLIIALVQIGMGFTVIDVHGDLSRMILSYLASTCTNAGDVARVAARLVWIEPFNSVYAPRINLLRARSKEFAFVDAVELLAIFKRLWKDVTWGPRMEEVLKNTLWTLALSSRPLIEAPLLLTKDEFRNHVISNLTEPDLLFYWNTRFASFSDRMKPMVTEPVANRISILTEGPLMRHLAAQKESRIDFREILDRQRWCIINLSKGLLSQNASLLGSLFTHKIKSAAMSRVDIEESKRVLAPFFVDEFQNFVGDNYEEILSEARKFRLALILAHQNLAQLQPSMRAAIFGNIGTMLLFRLGHHDIREFAQEFNSTSQTLVRQTLSTLQVAEAVKREDDGSFRKIEIDRLSRFTTDESVARELLQACYDRYYRPRAEIDAELIKARSVSARSSVVIYESPKWARKSPSDAGDEVSP